jgi:hypothetical protein
LISGSPRPGIGTDGSSNGTNTAEPSSGAGSQGSLFTMTSVPSAPTISAPSIVSPAGSRARGLRAPGSGLGSLILRLRCGPSSSGSFASFDPGSSSSRTWRTFSLSMMEPCGVPFSGTWPRSGMTWRGIAFRLPPLALRMAVTGSSPLLGTPTARDWKDTGDMTNVPTNGLLGRQVRELKLLPTPNAWDGQRGPDYARARKGEGREQSGGDDLTTTAFKLSNGASTSPPSTAGSTSTGLRLNPSFVEWMMGAPACGECGRGWTDIDCPHSATAYTSTSDGSSARRSP